MRLMNLTEAAQQRTNVVPLNIVIQRVSKDFLKCQAVVVVQLEWHSQPLAEGRGLLPSQLLSPL